MTFAEFVEHWRTKSWPADWRRGQSLFNALHDVRPELARELTGTLSDPFYSDSRIVSALDWVGERWERP